MLKSLSTCICNTWTLSSSEHDKTLSCSELDKALSCSELNKVHSIESVMCQSDDNVSSE